MSASLLHKSLKLSEENKELKKKNLKKKKLVGFKWKKVNKSSVSKEEETKELIQKNIKKLEELDENISLSVAEKIFARKHKLQSADVVKSKEEKTVFTEEDFEEFEKEYFAS